MLKTIHCAALFCCFWWLDVCWANTSESYSVGDSERAFSVANQQYLEGNYSAALYHLEQIQESESDYVASRLLMSRVFISQRKARAAEAEIRTLMTLGLDTEITLPLLLDSLLAQSKFEAVLESAIPISESDTFNSEIYVYRGQAYHGIYERRLAIDSFKEALLIKPNNEHAILGLATIYSEVGELDKSHSFVETALGLNPNCGDALLIQANLMFRQGDFTQASTLVNRLLENNPENHKARIVKAAILIHKTNYEEALDDLDLILRQLPNEPVAKYLKASATEAIGDRVGAVEIASDLRLLLDKVPNSVKDNLPLLYYLTAIVNYRTGAFEMVNKSLNRYLKWHQRDIGALKLLASTQLALGEVFTAKETLLKALEYAPRDTELRIMLAKNFVKNGNLKIAKEHSEFALSFEPQNAEYLETYLAIAIRQRAYQSVNRGLEIYEGDIEDLTEAGLLMIAKSLLETNQLKRGFRYVKELVSQQPNSEHAHILKGSYLGLLGDVDGSRQSFEKAITLNPLSHQAAIHLSRIDYATGKRRRAYNRLRDLAPRVSSSSVWTELGNMSLGEENENQALNYFLQAVSINPASVISTLNSSYIYAKRKQFDDAMAVLDSFITQNKETREVYFQKINLLTSLGNVDGALKTVKEMKKVHEQDPEVWLLEAKIYEQHKRYKEALIAYKHFVLLAPDYTPVYERLVSVSARAGDATGARHFLRKFRLKSQDNGESLRVEGDMLRYLNDLSAAKTMYKSALMINKNLATYRGLYLALQEQAADQEKLDVAIEASSIFPNELFMSLAVAKSYQDVGDFERSQARYQTLLEGYPDDPIVLNNAAQLFILQGDNIQSMQLAEKAYQIAPNMAEINDTLGWAYALNGKFDLALTSLQKAELLKYKDPEITYHLALVLYKLGRSGDAKRKLLEVKDMGEEDLVVLAERQLNAMSKERHIDITLR